MREGHDVVSPRGVPSEDAVEAHERMTPGWDQGAESRQKLNRAHHAVGLAAARVLDAIGAARNGDYAIIAYADDGVATTHLQMGSEKLAGMTDEQILEFWNDGIDARDDFMAEQELVAIEIPMGKPQLKYEQRSDQWVPRGHVVKGVILGGDGDEIDDECVTVDGKDLTIREFVRMMSTFGGWGFRLVFVADTDIHDESVIEVREPAAGE